jgi:hypothetical protein
VALNVRYRVSCALFGRSVMIVRYSIPDRPHGSCKHANGQPGASPDCIFKLKANVAHCTKSRSLVVDVENRIPWPIQPTSRSAFQVAPKTLISRVAGVERQGDDKL